MQKKHFPNIAIWSNDELEKAYRYFSKELSDETNPIEISSLRERLMEIMIEQSRRSAVAKR